jgi:tellurite resistance protein TerC
MNESTLLWLLFHVFVLAMLALDLGVFHRKSHEVSVREALLWTVIWITLAMLFNLFIYLHFDRELAVEFFTGYVLEKSLSVDNIFVMVMIFSAFDVPKAYQHKVLFYGIVGALLMRAGFIFAGIELIHRFHWLMYVFGAFLIFTGIRMLTAKESTPDPENSPFIKVVSGIFPVTTSFVGDRFFVRIDGRRWITPLFLVVVLIEATDLIFAVDSIPAILAISENPFIVYTSNVFAILGLRSLYFALAGIEQYFIYLKYGLSVILVFVGAKMAFVDLVKIPIELSLGIIIGVLIISMLASTVATRRRGRDQE